MNEVFREILHCFIIIYIDDILIYHRNLAEHRHHIMRVLQMLREHQIYLNLEKCEFHLAPIHFLGYIIDELGIQMDQKKVQELTTTLLCLGTPVLSRLCHLL